MMDDKEVFDQLREHAERHEDYHEKEHFLVKHKETAGFYVVLGLATAVAMSFCSVILAAAGYIAKVW